MHLVFPPDINPRGTLYGGRLMDWIATAGTLTASRCAAGPVVLGAMDDLDFIHPVSLGEIVTISSQVEDIGRTSLELGVEVHSDNPRTGVRRRTTSSHLAFIALDDRERPRPAGAVITPRSPEERDLHARAADRRARRIAGLRAGGRSEAAASIAGAAGAVRMSRFVRPEDALDGTLMFAGRLLRDMDELAAIAALRYCHLPTVTASLDTVSFSHPLRVGQIADAQAAVVSVGRSSLEIAVEVDAEEPWTGTRRRTCTAFLTMVHLDPHGRPAPVPPRAPDTPEARAAALAAEERRAQRRTRVAALRASAAADDR